MKTVGTAVLACVLVAGCTNGSAPLDASDPGMDAMVDPDADDGADLWLDPNTLPDGAPDPCIGSTSCDDCTSRTPCGWCNGACLAGSESGPFGSMCNGSNWMWRGAQCPGTGVQCPSHTDCVSCAMDPDGCGWCTNLHRCVAGDSTGPADTSIQGCSATAGTWVYNLQTMTCP